MKMSITFYQIAIEFITKFGWMLLPHYKFDLDLGIWVNREEAEYKKFKNINKSHRNAHLRSIFY